MPEREQNYAMVYNAVNGWQKLLQKIKKGLKIYDDTMHVFEQDM